MDGWIDYLLAENTCKTLFTCTERQFICEFDFFFFLNPQSEMEACYYSNIKYVHKIYNNTFYYLKHSDIQYSASNYKTVFCSWASLLKAAKTIPVVQKLL